MMRYIAFLRGINVSGQRLVSMDDLKAYFGMPGINNVSTYLQSGNVLFETDEMDEELLCNKIEAQLHLKLGYEVRVILRMFHELNNIVKNNPYDHLRSDDNRKLYVTLLSGFPANDVRGSLGVYSNDAEDARIVRREVYILSSNYGQTCFPNSLIEKKLGVFSTTRDWITINKMLEL